MQNEISTREQTAIIEPEQTGFPCTATGCTGTIPEHVIDGYTYVGDCQTCKTPDAIRRSVSGLDPHTIRANDIRDRTLDILNAQPVRTNENYNAYDTLLGQHNPPLKKAWVEGNAGSGKTFLCLHAMKNLIEQTGCKALFLPEATLLNAWRCQFKDESRDWGNTLYQRAKSVDVLLIDDFGQTRDPSMKALDAIDAVIMARYESQKPMMITTNLKPARLEAHRGPRIVSRLFELAGAPIVLTGADWRKQNDRSA